jgi:hypothetical protein
MIGSEESLLVVGPEEMGPVAGSPGVRGWRSDLTPTHPAPAWAGASPAQDASLRESNRRTSPTSTRMTSAMNGPMSRSWVKILTRGPGRSNTHPARS